MSSKNAKKELSGNLSDDETSQKNKPAPEESSQKKKERHPWDVGGVYI